MKKQLLAFVAGLILCGTFAFTGTKYYEQKQNTAEVEQYQGLYIFSDCKPVSPFDYLGTEKVSISLGTGQYSDIRNKLIRKVKKEYPKANGIILHLENNGTDRADAVFLK